MSLKFGTETVSEVKFNNQDVKQIIYNGQSAWCKPYVYLRGNLPTGVASLTCHRASSNEPTASTNVGTTAIIYHGDVLYWTAEASTGYSVSVTHGSSNPITVTGAVGGVSDSGVSASLNSYSVTISATNCKSVYLSTSSTATSGSASGTSFNYGTTVYGFAELNDNTAQYSYSAPSGWTHITGRIYRIGSITVNTSGNSISGAATSTLNSYTITFNKPTYGSWGSSTKTAYYGDYISVSGTTVICKAGGSSGSERWRNTCTRTADTAQYSYWLSIDSGYGVTITGNYTIATSSGRDVRYYTVTWKYRNGYDSWTTTTTSVAYGSSPSAPVTPSTVTSGSYRRVPGSWDNTSSITGERTINMTYTDQVYITCSGTRCSSSNSGWYNTGSAFTATWTANSNCAFTDSGDQGAETEDSQYIQVGTTPATYSKSADYIYVQISNGTGCSANVSTGWNWYSYNTQVTWTRSSGYAFDSSGTTTSSAYLTSPGSTYSKSCTYGYMTISTSNCSANYSSGWYALSGNNYTVTFTANSGYDFNGSSTTTVTKAVPNTFSATATATVVESWNTVTNINTCVITNTSYWNVYNLGSGIQYQFKTQQPTVLPARLRITILTKSGLSYSQGASYNAASYKFTSEKTIYANEGFVTVHNDGTFDYDIMVTQNNGYVYVTVRTVDDEGWEDTEFFTNNSKVQIQLYY